MGYYEEDHSHIVQPIFEALIKNKASDELFKNVFLDVNIPEYFYYLPETVKNDPSFLKECLEKNKITLNQVNREYLNQDFISKEIYIDQVSKNPSLLSLNIYPQDEEMVYDILLQNSNNYLYIDESFKKNVSFMLKCLVATPDLFRLLNQDIKETFLQNKELLISTLKEKPFLFNHLDNEKQSDESILLATLNSFAGYYCVRGYLRNIKNPEITLLALLHGEKDARKHIHQSFITIFNKNNIKDNYYEFLKSYLEHKKLNETLHEQLDSTKQSKPKMKI